MNEINAAEERLRAEIEELKRQLAEQKKLHEAGAHPRTGPSAGTLVMIALAIIGLVVVGFVAGYLPRQKREQVLAAESKETVRSLPSVAFSTVERASAKTELVLPGNIQAVTEAPILARATGYIRKRNADIGDRVRTAQVLAEIEAPELDQQILQATAAAEQTRSAVQQAQAALEQGQANENLAKVTAGRWDALQKRGVVSKQENDTYQAQYTAQQANVRALEKSLSATCSNVSAVEANLDRLKQIKTYQTVRAPFDGVITLRNVDTGALVNEGNTLLFRIAQTGSLRAYVNLPQSEVDSVRAGQHATLTIAELPGRKFDGTVTRTSNALDPATRTLLTEVQVPNPEGRLMPGMFAQVDLSVPRRNPPLVIPGDTLVVRSDGPQVALIGEGDKVHFARVQLGRDFGDRLEVLGGLEEGQRLAVNPSDAVTEGVKVNPRPAEKAAKKQ
ncbi:MAG TPA: efflux RND transporter periplasmic adaptor subunit [Candidatus Solibacter sp.]|nr:efflux RND transporter periplasmic adaptor subunit [Candidatus Solibacter sp.]